MNDYYSLNGVLKPLLRIVDYGGAQLQPFYTCVINNSPLFIVILRLTLAPFLVISSCHGERYFESFGLAFQETTLAFQPSDIISCAELPRPGLGK